MRFVNSLKAPARWRAFAIPMDAHEFGRWVHKSLARCRAPGCARQKPGGPRRVLFRRGRACSKLQSSDVHTKAGSGIEPATAHRVPAQAERTGAEHVAPGLAKAPGIMTARAVAPLVACKPVVHFTIPFPHDILSFYRGSIYTMPERTPRESARTGVPRPGMRGAPQAHRLRGADLGPSAGNPDGDPTASARIPNAAEAHATIVPPPVPAATAWVGPGPGLWVMAAHEHPLL